MGKPMVVAAVQFLTGLLVPIVVYIAGIGDGWELIAFAVGGAVVVTLVGLAFGRLFAPSAAPKIALFFGALLGGLIASLLLLVPRAWGFAGMLLPVAGCVIGYHLASFVRD